MPENHFGEDVAAGYDDDVAAMYEPELVDRAVAVLAELAGGGAALEFGVGTGRIALPLAAAGVPVLGIDLSPEMIARLRAKPGADAVPATVGDFATTRVDGAFRLVVLVFNTIMNLTTQDEQVACFRNAAAHLEPGGHFVIECIVPQLRRLNPGDLGHVFSLTPTHVGVDEYDPVDQTAISHHFRIGDDGVVLRSMPFRYVWPSELDLMARLAGLRLAHRWADWDRSPFTVDSESHVSVWQLPSP